MKVKTGITAVLLAGFMISSIASCGADTENSNISRTPGNNFENSENWNLIKYDKEGNPIILPEKIERIISMGPSNTEILYALGCGEWIIAADNNSVNIEGINNIPLFDMYVPDSEKISALNPDVIFVTGMSKSTGINPFKSLEDIGICVIYIPSSTSMEGIKDDIRFVAAIMKKEKEGDEIIKEMEDEIKKIREIGETITERKTVYFEISESPYMYSFGSGVYLNDMIRFIGAENIFAEQESWLCISDEVVLEANPDVILTNVDDNNDPVGEILSRPGWNEITAVKNKEVYFIDSDASSRPNQNIIKALYEMARVVYPEQFQ